MFILYYYNENRAFHCSTTAFCFCSVYFSIVQTWQLMQLPWLYHYSAAIYSLKPSPNCCCCNCYSRNVHALYWHYLQNTHIPADKIKQNISNFIAMCRETWASFLKNVVIYALAKSAVKELHRYWNMHSVGSTTMHVQSGKRGSTHYRFWSTVLMWDGARYKKVVSS